MVKYKLYYLCLGESENQTGEAEYISETSVDWIRDKRMIEKEIEKEKGIKRCAIYSYQEASND